MYRNVGKAGLSNRKAASTRRESPWSHGAAGECVTIVTDSIEVPAAKKGRDVTVPVSFLMSSRLTTAPSW